MLRILIILAVGAAAYAAFGQSTTSVRPNGIGGYSVIQNGRVTQTIRPNGMGGYNVNSGVVGPHRATISRNPVMGGYDITPVPRHHPIVTRRAPYVPYQ